MENPYLLVSPAFAGYVAAFVLMAPTLQASAKAGPAGKSRAFLFAALPVTGPLFAFVAAFLATGALESDPALDATTPLLLLGGAVALQCIAQAFLVRSRLPALDANDPQDPGFGKLLVATAACETITLLAFIYAFLSLGSP